MATNYDKPSFTGSRGGGLLKKALQFIDDDKSTKGISKYQGKMNQQKNEAFKERQNNEQWNKMLKQGQKLDQLEPDVRPVVEDLPKEDLNEKKMTFDTGDDRTVAEPKEFIPAPEFDESEVVDTGDYDEDLNYIKTPGYNVPTPEELEGLNEEKGEFELPPETNTDTESEEQEEPSFEELSLEEPSEEKAEEQPSEENAQEEPSEEKPSEEKQEPSEEETQDTEEDEEEVMSDEDALKEAQELAQDELTGFRISGANWQKMSEKQKAAAIKAFMDANRNEDHSTNIDKSETNNYEQYKRYPTGLKVAEDILGETNTIAGGVKDVAEKIGGQGKNSGSIAREVAGGVPHYDYRSLFN